MKSTQLRLLLPMMLLLLAGLTPAAVPTLINYQGYVTDASGTPVGAGGPIERTVEFRFWDQTTGGAPGAAGDLLYAETQTVTINEGNFSVLIGSGAATGEALNATKNPTGDLAGAFGDANVFLGITVDDGVAPADPEIAPRQQIVTTAFAFRAKIAEEVENLAITNAMLSGGITGAKIADNSLGVDDLGTGSVGGDEILDGAVKTDKIKDLHVTTKKLKADAVTTAKIGSKQVQNRNIGDKAVDTAQIEDKAVERAKIGDKAVDTAQIEDKAVERAKIGDKAVGTFQIADKAIGNGQIADNTISAAQIGTSAVGTSELQNKAVTDEKLGAKTVSAEETLRIVRGRVLKSTTIQASQNPPTGEGVGYKYRRLATGRYNIDFDTHFSGKPTVTVTMVANGDNIRDDNVFLIDTVSASGVEILCVDIGVGTTSFEDASFHFIAIGPR